MFPNAQDALPLPLRPNLERYKRIAKDLVKACKSVDPDAIGDWAEVWVKMLVQRSGIESHDKWVYRKSERTFFADALKADRNHKLTFYCPARFL